MEFVFIIIGFVLLIKASDFFVDASTFIAKVFKIPEIVIGATIVSIGTTLPETMVSATSAFKGHGDIAYGNAIGSIVCNTALISAISLIFSPSIVKKKDLKPLVAFFFSSFALYLVFAYVFKEFTRLSGLLLISIFVAYVFYVIKSNKNNSNEDIMMHADELVNEKKDNASGSDKTNGVIKSFLVIIVSAIVIAFASNLLVDNGTLIAKKFGVPESVIGLTMIALGTSLPELSTAITSLIKGHSNLSIGNIIGANFFNVVLVTGIASVVGPFKLPSDKLINGMNASLVFDIPIAFVSMAILCIPTLICGKTKRWQGIALICVYILFLVYQFKF